MIYIEDWSKAPLLLTNAPSTTSIDPIQHGRKQFELVKAYRDSCTASLTAKVINKFPGPIPSHIGNNKPGSCFSVSDESVLMHHVIPGGMQKIYIA